MMNLVRGKTKKLLAFALLGGVALVFAGVGYASGGDTNVQRGAFLLSIFAGVAAIASLLVTPVDG